MANRVDTSGFEKKMSQLATLAGALEKLPQDAASFFQAKLLGETLAKASTSQAGVRQGNQFIRTLSGNLRRAQVIEQKNPYAYHIFYRHGKAGVDYGKYVDDYAKEKYGEGYYGLTLTIWGKTIQRRIKKEAERLVNAIDDGRVPRYKNPLPL